MSKYLRNRSLVSHKNRNILMSKTCINDSLLYVYICIQAFMGALFYTRAHTHTHHIFTFDHIEFICRANGQKNYEIDEIK